MLLIRLLSLISSLPTFAQDFGRGQPPDNDTLAAFVLLTLLPLAAKATLIAGLAKLFRAPYWPVPPYLVPIPMPVQCRLIFGEPMHFKGDGTESDQVIDGYVEQVRERIAALVEEGRVARREAE